MSLATTTSRKDYILTGGVYNFPFPYLFQNDSDLVVVYTDTLGNQTTLVLNSGYTVAGEGTISGSITVVTNYTSGILSIKRVVGLTQDVVLDDQGKFSSTVIENEFDKLTMIDQQLAEALSELQADYVPPTAGISWYYDTQTFTATAGQTVFTITKAYTTGLNMIAVFLNGVRLVNGVDFTETSTTSITLASGATLGDTLVTTTNQYVNPLYGTTASVLQSNLASTAGGLGASMVGYLAPYTGAVATTQSGLNTDTLALANFAPVGDGVTDDTAALTAALAARPVLNLVAGKTYLVAGVSVPAGATINGNGATLKLKALGTGVYTPILNITGPNVTIRDGNFDGNKAVQFPNAFADAYDTGSGGTGWANRCAIKADNNGGSTIYNVKILNCTISNTWGASIATRDVSYVLIDGCRFANNNFGCALYTTSSAIRNLGNKITNCSSSDIASGDASVNADVYLMSNCDYGIISNCTAKNWERDFAKFEGCNYSKAIGNTGDTNTKDTFFGIQFQAASGFTCVGNQAIGNTILNCYAGITAQCQSGTAAHTDFLVENNTIIARTQTSAGGTQDGISVAGPAQRITITGNTMKNVCRTGILVQDASDVLIQGNQLWANGTPLSLNVGIYIKAISSNQTNIIVKDNYVGPFTEATNVGTGGISFFTSGGFTINDLVIDGNYVQTMTNTNVSHGIYTGGAYGVNRLILTNNTVLGTIEVYPTSLICYGNNALRLIQYSGLGNIRGQGNAAPAAGSYYIGDIWLNTVIAASGNLGWICTTAGAPGTWKTWGAISA